MGKEGQCHKIFDNVFCLKDSTWGPYKQTKTVSCRYSLKTCVSIVNDYGVNIVNNYAVMMSAWSITRLTQFQRSQRLPGHRVSVVNNYANTVSP